MSLLLSYTRQEISFSTLPCPTLFAIGSDVLLRELSIADKGELDWLQAAANARVPPVAMANGRQKTCNARNTAGLFAHESYPETEPSMDTSTLCAPCLQSCIASHLFKLQLILCLLWLACMGLRLAVEIQQGSAIKSVNQIVLLSIPGDHALLALNGCVLLLIALDATGTTIHPQDILGELCLCRQISLFSRP